METTMAPERSDMEMRALRLTPGQDLRRALECAVYAEGCSAAFVLSGIGSLERAHLRRAGADDAEALHGPLEVLTLAGTIAANGSHLHASLADASGAVQGGHLAYGCLVRTTAEVLLGLLPGLSFRREPDLRTGFAELVVRPEGGPAGSA